MKRKKNNHRIQINLLKLSEIGKSVKMVDCYEAGKYPDKIWKTRSEPWELWDGNWVVLLEGKSGSFAIEYLEVV